MASLTRWTWVWVNSGSWWWTGRPGVLWFMGSQRVGHDWATDLIWSDQTFSINFKSGDFISLNVTFTRFHWKLRDLELQQIPSLFYNENSLDLRIPLYILKISSGSQTKFWEVLFLHKRHGKIAYLIGITTLQSIQSGLGTGSSNLFILESYRLHNSYSP